MNTPYRTRTELDLEATIGSLAAHVTELEADKAALKRQLEEAWAAADAARAQRDRAMEESARLIEHGSEALDQRDRARATAVALEQQLARVVDEMASLERSYEQLRDKEPTAVHQAALDAVYDCSSSVEVTTNVIGLDMYIDEAKESA